MRLVPQTEYLLLRNILKAIFVGRKVTFLLTEDNSGQYYLRAISLLS